MPHVVIKLYPGRSDQQKSRLAEQIVKDVTATLNCGEESVSVAIEDIEPGDWAEKVYKADIIPQLGEALQEAGIQDVKEEFLLPFENKVALVTGAGSGMGLATATAFAEAGASVALVDNNEESVRSATNELVSAGRQALAIRCDVAPGSVCRSLAAGLA